MNREAASRALKEIKRIFNSIGIKYFLNYGTALGIYRDRDFLPGDKDIDIGVFGMEHQKTIEKAFEKYGWKIRTDGRRRWLHVPLEKSVKVDILLYKENGPYLQCWVKQDQPWMYFPKHFNKLTRIKFEGEFYPILADTEGWLAWVYGDWKNPENKKSANPTR